MPNSNRPPAFTLFLVIPFQLGCWSTCGDQITGMGAYTEDPLALYLTTDAAPSLEMAVQELGGSVLSQGLVFEFVADESGIADLWVLNPEQETQDLDEFPCTRPELVLTFSLTGAGLDPEAAPPEPIVTLEEDFAFTYDREVDLWDGWIVTLTASGITP